MVVEVAGDERDIEVAGFADRFTIVHRLQDRQKSGMFLDEAGNRIKVAGALRPR